MTRYLSTLAIALAAALIATAAQAETVVLYREGQRVDPMDVARVLGNQTRSIRLLDAPATAAPKIATVAMAPTAHAAPSASSAKPANSAPADAADDPSALSLPVHFAFDSVEIQASARAQLDALAEGIKLLSPDRIVTVEGHTDATGTEAYNLELSRGRARAVRDYLVQQHGIDAARLRTAGYGKDRPIEVSDPFAAVNRRVQFRGS